MEGEYKTEIAGYLYAGNNKKYIKVALFSVNGGLVYFNLNIERIKKLLKEHNHQHRLLEAGKKKYIVTGIKNRISLWRYV